MEAVSISNDWVPSRWAQDDMLKIAHDPPFGLKEMTSRMVRGDEAAYQQFYEQYRNRLFRYLIVITHGNEDLSRDLLQIAMIKVVRYIKPFEEENIFWGWLAQIMRVTFIDNVRKQKRMPETVLLEPEESQAITEGVSPQDSLPLMDALHESLGELEEKEREIIQLIYFEKATHQVVADKCDTTPKAIESKLSRIRQKLRKTMIGKLQHENNS